MTDAQELLESLRWREDVVITNPFDERVWLKACFRDGRRTGITDCCSEDVPCEWHRGIAAAGQNRGTA